jgi:hypothetical protein
MMSGHTKYHEQLENELLLCNERISVFIEFWIPRNYVHYMH